MRRPFVLIVTALLLIVTALLLIFTAACGSDDGDDTEQDTAEPATLTVYAAASLKSTFTQIGEKFEAEHPGVTVEFSFAGSSDLVAQIENGAPADVFASADIKNMDKAADLVDGDPANFATNVLQIATPPDHPAQVGSLDDLTASGVKVVVCAPEVPCGNAAVTVEKSAGIDIKPVSEEQSVTDVLNKVISGEADAGLVYVTDVTGAGEKVKGITFPESDSAVNTYPIAALSGGDHLDLAHQFVTFVTGSVGQGILTAAGFGTP